MENLLFIALLALVAGVFVAGYFITRNLRQASSPFDTKTVHAKWAEIEKLLNSDSTLSWKMSVIEADKLVDSALKTAGMRGETMGERIRFAVSRYPKIKVIWQAHILRNDLVHETDRQLNRNEAEKALSSFKEGLKVLRAL